MSKLVALEMSILASLDNFLPIKTLGISEIWVFQRYEYFRDMGISEIWVIQRYG